MLRENHLTDLRSSGIDDSLIDLAKLGSADRPTIRKILGFDAGCGGLVIPYLHTNGSRPPFARIKPDRPFKDTNGHVAKYLSPKNSGNHLYIPPVYNDAHLQDIHLPIIISEGEKKALKGGQDLTAYCVLALPGVWCFRSKTEQPLLKDFDRIQWAGRQVYICYDSDVTKKNDVRGAENALARALLNRGARVNICRIPAAPDGGKCGLDDYLIAHDTQDFENNVLFLATEWQESETVTEDSVALLFEKTYADELRYCKDWGRWLKWQSTHWREDRTDLAMDYARSTVRTVNPDGRPAIARRAFAYGVEAFARAARCFATEADQWDRDDWLFNTPNATIDTHMTMKGDDTL